MEFFFLNTLGEYVYEIMILYNTFLHLGYYE